MGRPRQSGLTASPDSLVGRELEVGDISEAIVRVEEGSGQSMVVTGSLGLGKSRIIDEAVKLASSRSFGILRGAGGPMGSGLAFASVVHAVGRALYEVAPPNRAKLVRGLDSLGLVLEGLDLPTPVPLGDPSMERTRLFESMVRLIDRLAGDRPLLIAFDDVQWIDEASLDLLSYLALDLSSMRVLLLMAMDSYDASPRAERLLDQLRQTTTCTELPLGPLEVEQIEMMAERVLGGTVRPGDAEPLAEVAGGNPLLALAYIDEMARRGGLRLVEQQWAITIDPHDTVPSVAREAYVARISRLDDRALTVLETIAIGGGEVSAKHLRAVSELNDAELVEPQRQLESAGLIDIDSQREAVSYRCSHPVVSRVAYDRVPVAQRQRTHARFIEILEKEPVGSEALVWHYRLVGGEVDQSRRLEVLTGAGRRALSKYANEDAVQILGTALDVARSSASVRDISGLLEDLGEAVQRTGEERAAIEIWREASSISQHSGDQMRLTRRIAAAESNLGHFSEARRLIESGMSTLADDTSPEAIELLAVGTLTSFRAGDIDAAAAGIDLFDRLVLNQPSELTTMNLAILRAGLALERSSYEEARAEARVAYDMAKAVNDPIREQQALAFLALVDLSLGDLVGLDGHLTANLDLTERIGIRLRAYRLLLYQFTAEIHAGRWEHAEEVAIDATLLAHNIEESRNHVVLVVMPALLDILRGDFELAASRLAEARQALKALGGAEPRLPALVDIVDAWSDLEAGQLARALATLEGRDGEFLQGLLPPWGMMLLGEAQARVGDESWTVTAEQLAAMGRPGCLPWVWSRRLGALAAADPEGAIEEWTQAADGFNDLGMPFEAARARLQAAELKAPRGPLAVDRLKEDHRLFASLGATRYRDRAQKLLRSVGEAFSVGESRNAGALSPRQTEVARLVAEGLSNGDIADRLFISRRTVTTHLENIYRQLGMGSRTALTRYVLEQMP